jgi:ABC-type lipoprotein export system ATPase subunit
MTAALALDDVSYALDDGGGLRMLLDGFSQVFVPGAFTCLTGPSGCGKTTILSLLAGVCTPLAGLVRFGETGVSVASALARRDWRRANVGMIFQTCRLIDVLTVAEHMALVARVRDDPDAEAEGLRLARAFGLGDRIEQRPAQLSGGEKQRVALAQALASRPAIVLADEPTAALDRDNGARVSDALIRFARDRNAVVVAVSHDPAMIAAADAVVRLEAR